MTMKHEPRRLGAIGLSDARQREVKMTRFPPVSWAAIVAVCTVVGTVAAQPPSPLPYETRFYTHDGLRLESYLYRPAGPGPYPLVVYSHGSATPDEEKKEWPAPFIARLLVPAGYAVLVPERRGYAKSEGKAFSEDIGADRGARYVARMEQEAGDVVAAVDDVSRDPSLRVDSKRVALMGWSFGGIVTTLAAARGPRFAAVVVQAPGALNWDRSSELRAALTQAATRIAVPIQCTVAENDRTTESARAVCAKARGTPAELKVYPPFTPTTLREGSAPGHALFSFQGVKIWGPDLLAFLARHLPPPPS
jgi:dienelactone hydrolase